MRAAAFTAFDSPDDIEVLELPEPTPGPEEAVVRVEAAALNHRNLWPLKGDAGDDEELPFVPGGDLAGTVEAIGEGAESVGAGDRVVLCPLLTCGECRFCRDGPENMCEDYGSYDGGFAERALVRADRLVALPDGVDFVTAAALPIAYMTAYRMLKRAEVTAEDRVFVPGATGGVGLAAVQLAAIRGAETIGTSRSSEKLSRVEDLDHAIRTDDPDEMREAVREIGEVDVTVNHLSGPYTRVGAEVLRTNGAMVVCGKTAGRYPEFDAREFYFGHKRMLGSTLGTQPDLERLVEFVADGRLEPVVSKEYPLAGAAEAYGELQARNAVGKLVVRPQE